MRAFGAFEGKRQFVGIEHMEDDHLVAAEAQMLDALQDLLFVVQKIADQDDDAANQGIGQGRDAT